MLFLILRQRKEKPVGCTRELHSGSEKGVGGRWGKIIRLVWRCIDMGSFQMMGTLPDSHYY